MKHKFIFLSILISILVLSACAPQSPTPGVLIPVKLPVGYVPNIQFAPLYMAIEKGYFKNEGLDVAIDYNMETDSVALLGAGQLQFAIVSGEQILLGRSKGLPVVYAAAWYNNFPVGVIVDPARNVTRPADLKGLTIGLPGLYGANYIGLRALLAAGGLQESDVKLNSIGYTQVENFIAARVDAASIYVPNEPVILDDQGVPYTLLRVSDYTSLVANGLATSEAVIKDHPDMVRGMVKALLHGISDAVDNPDEAFEISKKYVENLDKADHDVQMAVLKKSIEYWRSLKPGSTQPEAWENMQTLLLDMGILDKPQDLTKAYTNDFLPSNK
ncbi:MAG: ABC transporter substrate-binding protein [Leptolinea sp.]|jgi:NitT/TauT family transport system substrate-binding protein|nr:ABC transporter substrate-binding protein [Leptolinea sp.]